MQITEAIRRRRSVRAADAALIEQYIAGLQAPFGIQARIRLIRMSADKSSKRSISGATDYLALTYKPAPLAEAGAGYIFEQAILYCTSIGIGTCWLGGSFSRKNFKRQLRIAPTEKLCIVSPAGYAADRQSFVERFIVCAEKHYRRRKPFGTNFFLKNANTPLTEEADGMYALPLEMARLAPSASNAQSWRVTLDDDRVHFYRTFGYGFAEINAGIALCHFAETCRETGIDGLFYRSDFAEDDGYVISWKTLSTKPGVKRGY